MKSFEGKIEKLLDSNTGSNILLAFMIASNYYDHMGDGLKDKLLQIKYVKYSINHIPQLLLGKESITLYDKNNICDNL